MPDERRANPEKPGSGGGDAQSNRQTLGGALLPPVAIEGKTIRVAGERRGAIIRQHIYVRAQRPGTWLSGFCAKNRRNIISCALLASRIRIDQIFISHR